jgi:branched-chain amino acid transport system permease protein
MFASMPASMPADERRSLDARWQVGALICVICIALLLPVFVSNYRMFQATMLLVYAIAVFGLNILTGYNGQISIGHGAFYAIGAYTAAILIDYYGWPYWLSILPAALICFCVGILIGIPALRLEGHYLALATFAFAMALPQLLRHKAFEHWTGGVQGISLSKPEVPAALPISQDAWLYYMTLAVSFLLFWLGRNLLRGRLGYAMTAIRDNSIAAAAMGINVSLCKTITFAISATYTGVAGALAAIVVQFVAPDSFNFFVSISFIAAVVIGGIGTISGAFYGAAFIIFMPNWADHVSKAAPWAVYGMCLILFLYAMPGGIASIVSGYLPRIAHSILKMPTVLRRIVGSDSPVKAGRTRAETSSSRE